MVKFSLLIFLILLGLLGSLSPIVPISSHKIVVLLAGSLLLFYVLSLVSSKHKDSKLTQLTPLSILFLLFLSWSALGYLYSADPEIDPDAKKYDSLTFKEVIEKELRVMDLTAVTLCKENNLPIIVFDIKSKNGLVDIVHSVPIGTTVS